MGNLKIFPGASMLLVLALTLVSMHVSARPIFEKSIDTNSIDVDKKIAYTAGIAASRRLDRVLSKVSDSTGISPSENTLTSVNSVNSKGSSGSKVFIADYKLLIPDGVREFFSTDDIVIDGTDVAFEGYGFNGLDEIISIDGGSLHLERGTISSSYIVQNSIYKGNLALPTSNSTDGDTQYESYSYMGGGSKKKVGVVEICAIILVLLGIIYLFVLFSALEFCAMIVILLGITYYFTRFS